LSTANLRAMTTTQISGLTTTGYTALTATQLAGLSTSQFAALDEIDASFTLTQRSGLSADQVNALMSPLVLDLDGSGIQTVSQSKGVNFDLNNDGNIDKAGWVGGADGLLVRDISGDGVINHGGELFGEGTVLADGSKAKDGYQALAALDSNLDGLIDARDAAFGYRHSHLPAWVEEKTAGRTRAACWLHHSQAAS
jgi:hypothetical protein